MDQNREGFRADAFAELAKLEAGNWWFRARNRVILWVVEKKIGPFRRFMEVGCGTGFVIEAVHRAYPSAEFRGVEYFEEGLVFARQRVPAATFQRLDATVPVEGPPFDVIGAFDVIEHIEQDELALENLAGALTPGGHLLISVPQHMFLWSPADEYACHVRRYDRADLFEKIEKTGLKVRYASSFVSLLLPLMWLSRRGAKSGAEYVPRSEFKIGRGMNAALEFVMRVEHVLMKCGVRFPFGGSLLVLAEKPTG